MTETLTFDAGWLARAWLSVAEASSKDTGRPALDRTVCVEFFPDGVRLVATDSYMLLTAWVPSIEAMHDEPEAPPMDEAPDAAVVAIDTNGRAMGLFAYLLGLTRGDDAPEILVKLATGASPETSMGMFDGLQGECLTIAAEDREALLLGLYEGDFPTWRRFVSAHRASMTPVLSLNPDILGRVVKMAKVNGADHVNWHFGGAMGPAKIDVEGAPAITGMVMPMHPGPLAPSGAGLPAPGRRSGPGHGRAALDLVSDQLDAERERTAELRAQLSAMRDVRAGFGA